SVQYRTSILAVEDRIHVEGISGLESVRIPRGAARRRSRAGTEDRRRRFRAARAGVPAVRGDGAGPRDRVRSEAARDSDAESTATGEAAALRARPVGAERAGEGAARKG